MIASTCSVGGRRLAVPHYLIKFGQTPETWERLMRNPEDRRGPVAQMTEALGGKLVGYWYAFGEEDGYVLVEAPDNISAAAEAVAVAASGALRSVSTTVLLTVEEMLDALAKARAVTYRPPGA
jgi:uncharacterized protein with GYD domain